MGRPQVFDVAGLAESGLVLVEREGWRAISIRTVACELGVSPMALYRLVSDADHLHQLIAETAATAITPTAQGETMETGLRSWATAAYRHLCRYPGLVSYLVSHWTELPGWLDIFEALLAMVDEHGLSGPEAVSTVNAVFAYVLARAQIHEGALDGSRRTLSPLKKNPGRYPFMEANRAEFLRAQTHKHFTIGLDAMLAGLQTGKTSNHPDAGQTL